MMEQGLLVDDLPQLAWLEALYAVDVGEDALHFDRIISFTVPGRVPHRLNLAAFADVWSLSRKGERRRGRVSSLAGHPKQC